MQKVGASRRWLRPTDCSRVVLLTENGDGEAMTENLMEPQVRILVVEDDPSLSEVVCSLLEMNGHACVPAFSGTEARMLVDAAARSVTGFGVAGGAGSAGSANPTNPADGTAAAAPFDLVICDLMLPGMSGEELIAYIRRLSEVPVIVVSAKGQVVDRVALLRSGADDYLVKPFPLEELLARVEVQLRHAARCAASGPEDYGSDAGAAGPNPAEPETLQFGRWQACAADRTFAVDGRPVKLTRTEFDIVWLLMANPKRVFSRYNLLAAVHADGDLGEEKTASTHVGNIRAKLKGTGTEGYIETVWGVGFKLTADPR